MPGLYSARRHREELSSLSEEYETRLKELQAALTELKEENRRLSAEISLLRAQKQSISDAIIAAGEKREEMQRELDAFSAAQKPSPYRRPKRRSDCSRTCARRIPTRRRRPGFRRLKNG
ncbi:MAG: hypothetical protein ACLR06_16720 [Christensenellaceae bacterium]